MDTKENFKSRDPFYVNIIHLSFILYQYLPLYSFTHFTWHALFDVQVQVMTFESYHMLQIVLFWFSLFFYHAARWSKWAVKFFYLLDKLDLRGKGINGETGREGDIRIFGLGHTMNVDDFYKLIITSSSMFHIKALESYRRPFSFYHLVYWK